MRFGTCNGPPLGLNPRHCGPVAQLDRALDYESKGRAFESLRVHHEIQGLRQVCLGPFVLLAHLQLRLRKIKI